MREKNRMNQDRILVQSIQNQYTLLKNSPDDLGLWSTFAHLFCEIQFVHFDHRLKKALTLVLTKPLANHQDIVIASLSLLKLLPNFKELLNIASTNLISANHFINLEEFFSILQDPLLLGLMKKTLLADAEIEKLLTYLRYSCLILYETSPNFLIQNLVPFLYALAHQCFHTEYIYLETKEEVMYLQKFITSIKFSDPLTSDQKILLLLISCYRPLNRCFKLEKKVSADDLEMNELFFLHFSLPCILEKEKEQLKSQQAIQDPTSLKVQAQYETHPYPRWTSLNYCQPLLLQDYLRQHIPSLSEPLTATIERPTVLIAGCGTGQHALSLANQLPAATITALDLSLTSLAYASYQAKKLAIQTVTFHQEDILALKNQKLFDLIECSGVLHHLLLPTKGLENLIKLLKPTGFLHLGLYSKWGRQDVTAAQALIKSKKFQSDLLSIQKCRQLLFKLTDEELAKQVTLTCDFYSASGCRDLLFHVQEQLFTLPEIATLLTQFQLEFLGFDWRDSNIKERYLTYFPSDPDCLSLANWDLFESQYPQSFSGMYQFWVRKILS